METLLLSQVRQQLTELALPDTTDTNIVSLSANGVRLHVECAAPPMEVTDLEDKLDELEAHCRALEGINEHFRGQVERLKQRIKTLEPTGAT